MNRPIYNNTHILDDSIMAYDCEYRKDLEKYCDFLEWKIEVIMSSLDGSEAFFVKTIIDRDRLNKALDKACEQIVELNEYDTTTAEQWKEWALKDEHI